MLAAVADDVLMATLASRGVAADLARAEMGKLRRHPAYEVAADLARRLDRLERQVQARAALLALAPPAEAVPRRAGLTRARFLNDFYAANRPVVITDVVPTWPAFGRWTPEHLRDTYGDVPIDACMDREADPDYDMRAAAHARPTTMRALAERVLATDASNDFYLIARNHAIATGGLRGLLDDVGPLPDWLMPAPDPSWLSLWFGPGGTVTPLHHDANNICFCQIYGRKRFKLIAPSYPALLASARGFYAALDPDAPREGWEERFADVQVLDVELAPGEALFIPVGWWHQVRATTPSISFSLLSFAFPNQDAGAFAP